MCCQSFNDAELQLRQEVVVSLVIKQSVAVCSVAAQRRVEVVMAQIELIS